MPQVEPITSPDHDHGAEIFQHHLNALSEAASRVVLSGMDYHLLALMRVLGEHTGEQLFGADNQRNTLGALFLEVKRLVENFEQRAPMENGPFAWYQWGARRAYQTQMRQFVIGHVLLQTLCDCLFRAHLSEGIHHKAARLRQSRLFRDMYTMLQPVGSFRGEYTACFYVWRKAPFSEIMRYHDWVLGSKAYRQMLMTSILPDGIIRVGYEDEWLRPACVWQVVRSFREETKDWGKISALPIGSSSRQDVLVLCEQRMVRLRVMIDNISRLRFAVSLPGWQHFKNDLEIRLTCLAENHAQLSGRQDVRLPVVLHPNAASNMPGILESGTSSNLARDVPEAGESAGPALT